MYSNYIKSGILILLAGWLVASCTAVPNPEDDSFEGIIISASLDDEETRTSISKDGSVYKVLWSEGDRISVNGKLSNAVSSDDNGKKGVDFTINEAVSAPYKVLYPGTTSTNVISLPATQNYVVDNIDGASAASYGTATKNGENYTVRLDHFCGVLRFALNGSATLSKIEINSLGSEKLYGNFTLATDGNGFTGSWDGGTAGTLTYNCSVTLSNSDTYFYVAIPAQTYASGLEALVYQEDGAFMRLKFWGDGETLGRDDIVEFASKTFAAGRTENLLQINSLTAENGGAPTAESPGITVATYNVMRLDDENRPAGATSANSYGALARPANAIIKSCAEMQAALGKAIYNTGADLIGFQEIGDAMYSTSRPYSLENIASAQGASYTWRLNFPSTDAGNYKYSNGFAYKSSVLNLEESGKAWLRINSESYSTSSDSNAGDPNRLVVWGLFTHKVSGKQFYFFVTQLPTYGQDGGSGTSNTNMAGGVIAFARTKTTSPNRQILVGDMNSSPDHDNSAGYTKLKTYWTDAYEEASTAHQIAGDLNDWFYKKYPGTQSGTGENYLYSILQYTAAKHSERRVDHIMTKGKCTATSYRTIRNTYEFGTGDAAVTCAPSDHLPVVAYITLD